MRSATPARPSASPQTAGWIPRLAARPQAAQLAWAAWLATCLLCFFWKLGGAPLVDVDEGAFSEATREMLARGDFRTTYLNGELRFDKPILIYWLQAASVWLFGVHEWAFRLPSAIAASAWALLVLRLTQRLFDLPTGIVAMVLLSTALGPLAIAHAATADALLNLCLAGTLVSIVGYATTSRRSHVLAAYAWMAAGTLAKGPVAVLVPLLATGIWCVSERRQRELLRVVADPLGWAIFLAIAAPWYALEFAEQGERFVRGFFLRHNVERFASPLQGHGGAWFYYVPALLLVALPHSGLLLRILPALKTGWRDPVERLLWTWFLVVFVLFSIAGTKLPHYILYGATPLFILMARHRGLLQSRLLAYAPALMLLALLFVLPEVIAFALPRIRAADVAQTLAAGVTEFDMGYRVTLAAAIVAVITFAWRWRGDAGLGMAFTGLIVAAALIGSALPAIARVQQAPVVAAGEFLRQRAEPVVAWGINVPSASVYRGAPIPARRPVPGDVVLTRVDKLQDLPSHELLFAQGAVRIARIKEATPQ